MWVNEQSNGPVPPSHVWVPVAAVLGCEGSRDEQHNVHDPPDPNTAQREEFAHGRPSVAQAEAVHAKEAKQDTVDERGHEVVPAVPGEESWGGLWVGGLRALT